MDFKMNVRAFLFVWCVVSSRGRHACAGSVWWARGFVSATCEDGSGFYQLLGICLSQLLGVVLVLIAAQINRIGVIGVGVKIQIVVFLVSPQVGVRIGQAVLMMSRLSRGRCRRRARATAETGRVPLHVIRSRSRL